MIAMTCLRLSGTTNPFQDECLHRPDAAKADPPNCLRAIVSGIAEVVRLGSLVVFAVRSDARDSLFVNARETACGTEAIHQAPC